MKPILVVMLIFTLLMSGCKSTENPTPPKAIVITLPNHGVSATLAWGTKYPAWDKALYEALAKQDFSDVKSPCQKLDTHNCAAQLISKMAQYESSFKPETTYKESGHLQGVTSRGLFQLSIVSAKSKVYGCTEIKVEQDLHDPIKNIQCMVKIFGHWSRTYKVMLNGKKESGAGRYHSVGRETSGSYKKIVAYMEQF